MDNNCTRLLFCALDAGNTRSVIGVAATMRVKTHVCPVPYESHPRNLVYSGAHRCVTRSDVSYGMLHTPRGARHLRTATRPAVTLTHRVRDREVALRVESDSRGEVQVRACRRSTVPAHASGRDISRNRLGVVGPWVLCARYPRQCYQDGSPLSTRNTHRQYTRGRIPESDDVALGVPWKV